MPITRHISPIKAVQRGESTIASNASTLVVTVSAVNMAKSRLTLIGTRASDSSMSGTQDLGTIVLASPTQLTLTRNGTAATTLTMSWELTEYN